MTSYTIGKTRQIIDLNLTKGRVMENFEMSFEVRRVSDGGEFYGVIMDQESVDSTDPITFQPSNNGILTGQMTWNQGIKKKFYLVLYADDPVNVTVSIDITELQPSPSQKQILSESKDNGNIEMEKPRKKKWGFFKILIVILMVAIAGYLAYRYFKKRRSTKQKPSVLHSTPSTPPVAIVPVQQPAVSSPEPVGVKEPQAKNNIEISGLSDDLKQRIKSLPLE